MTCATQTAFAERIGVAKSYVTRLKQLGRLVLAENGLVDVEASLARLKETQDPAKPSHIALSDTPGKPDEQPLVAPPEDAPAEGAMNYQQARAVKEKYQALSAKLEYEQSCAQLLRADDVAAVIARVAVTLRTRFESFPDLLAPQLAEIRDEQQIRSLLADQVEILLSDLSAQFAKLARQAKP